MASLEIIKPFVFATGLPKPPPSEGYRFYACELKPTTWHCKETQVLHWEPSPGTLLTSLVPINKWVPRFLDPIMISGSLKKPVIVKS